MRERDSAILLKPCFMCLSSKVLQKIWKYMFIVLANMNKYVLAGVKPGVYSHYKHFFSGYVLKMFVDNFRLYFSDFIPKFRDLVAHEIVHEFIHVNGYWHIACTSL